MRRLRDDLQARLETAPAAVFSLFAVAAAFTTYFCMYAFRKPYAVATYDGHSAFGFDLKATLITAQLIGYALSKVLGVKFVSELHPQRRIVALVVLIAVAEFALLLFGLAPANLKPFAMFLNGLPLGAVWGLVFGKLEGRRTSEILGAGLSTSYIVASGAVKSVGDYVLQLGVGEFWMPAVTGLMFMPLFLVAAWCLSAIPDPTPEDIAARVEREPMNGAQRMAFIREFAVGLSLLTALYFFLTAYRDYRDNFAAEIWQELGMSGKPAIFTLSELPIAVGVMVALALLYFVKNNRMGLMLAHVIMAAGTALIGVSTLLFDAGVLSGVVWMISVGMGLYLAYVPYGCVLFDRMIAATGVVATAVFMIYVTDATGYIGSIGIMWLQPILMPEGSKLAYFIDLSYFTSVFCTVCFVGSLFYFWGRSRPAPQAHHLR